MKKLSAEKAGYQSHTCCGAWLHIPLEFSATLNCVFSSISMLAEERRQILLG